MELKKKREEKVITLYLAPELYKKFKSICFHKDVKMASMLREMIQEMVKRG